MSQRIAVAQIFIAGIIGAAEFVGCSESNQPYYYSGQQGDRQSSVGASITADELTVAHISGVPIDSSDGVFSIGWNQFVGLGTLRIRRGRGTHRRSSSTRVADLSGLRSSHAGEDIGSVYLNYSGNHQEFRKDPAFFQRNILFSFPPFVRSGEHRSELCPGHEL